MDFAGAKVRMTNCAQDIDTQRQRFQAAQQAITACNNVLGNLGTTYAEVIATIEAGVAANPANIAWQNAQAEKDLLVANFQALKVEVQAAVDALVALG